MRALKSVIDVSGKDILLAPDAMSKNSYEIMDFVMFCLCHYIFTGKSMCSFSTFMAAVELYVAVCTLRTSWHDMSTVDSKRLDTKILQKRKDHYIQRCDRQKRLVTPPAFKWQDQNPCIFWRFEFENVAKSNAFKASFERNTDMTDQQTQLCKSLGLI